MKHSRISRVVKILTTLQANQYYSVDELSKLVGTSRRTVFRDLKELQAIGVPYHYRPKDGGYSIDPDFFLPPIDLDLQEALSLLLLVHKGHKQIQLPFKNSALVAALKIENNLPIKIRQYCKVSLNGISVKHSPQTPTSGLDHHFGQLQEAIARKRLIEIKYDSFFDKRIIDVTLSPYHLLYNHRAWYILGYSSPHKSVRMFKLNRINKLTILDRCFVETDFDLQEHLGKAWALIPEGRIYEIKLLFSPKVARNVAEVRWHSTQLTKFNHDGSALVEFRVDGLNEITWWILGYGDQVEVLAPQVLRKKVIEVAQNILAKHQNLKTS